MRGISVTDMEPVLELCMKMQRITGVNGGMSEQRLLLIRVVPPRPSVPCGDRRFFLSPDD